MAGHILHSFSSDGPVRPSPPGNLGAIDTMLVGIGSASDLLVPEFLLRVSADLLEFGNAIDRIDRQTEAIDFVIHGQLHWRVNVPLLLVTADMQSPVLAAVRQSVDQPGITVEVEHDWLVRSE